MILPQPLDDTGTSLVQAIENRRSVRSYSGGSITLPELSRILHSAQGITSGTGYRAAPSAGATYPLTLYIISENVDGLQDGIYCYTPDGHFLSQVKEGEFLHDLAGAALGQSCITEASAALVITADYSITTDVYGERGRMYVHMEAGHVSENVYLQCAAMDLCTVAIGAFTDGAVADLLGSETRTPLYIMPLGRP